LNDSNAAHIRGMGTYGHAAFLVGTDATGWTYYSKNGDGDFSKNTYQTSATFFASQTASRYDRAVYIKTTALQDFEVSDFANKNYNTTYSGLNNNCGDLVQGSFAAGGIVIPFTGEGQSVLLHPLTTIPNNQYDSLTSMQLQGAMSIPNQQTLYPHSSAP
jgi:hypothetical protein